MRVKFVTTACGPTCQYLAGQVAEVDDAWGRELIKGGFADDATPPSKPTPEAPSSDPSLTEESATKVDPEPKKTKRS